MKRPPSLVGLLAVPGVVLAQPAEFIVIGPAPGGSMVVEALAISADGRFVVGKHSPTGGSFYEGFRWDRDGGTQRLPALHPTSIASWSEARCVSPDGMIVGGVAGDAGRTPNPQPVLWQGGTVIPISPPSSNPLSGVFGLGGSGSIRAGTTGYSAFIQSAGGPVNLLGQGAASSSSHDGLTIAGWVYTSTTTRAVRWSQGLTLEFLNADPTRAGRAIAVSSDGGTIVGHSGLQGSGARPVRWTLSTGEQDLGRFANGDVPVGSAGGVSADGLVIVGSYYAETSAGAFIWDPAHSIRNLRDVLVSEFGLAHALEGWSLTGAAGVSADGRTIVGIGSGPHGSRSWIVKLGYACFANCDGSSSAPALTAADFQCFLTRFAASDPYANCDLSTNSPVLNANDFMCFLNTYIAGCS